MKFDSGADIGRIPRTELRECRLALSESSVPTASFVQAM